MGSAPPAIAISVVRQPDGSLKDTARNILDTGVFTVSLPARSQGPEMVGTASRLPPAVSEIAALDIPSLDGDVVPAPRPRDAPFAMECRLLESVEVGHARVFIGEVVCFHLAEAVRSEGRDGNPVVDIAAMEALGRLGGSGYVEVREVSRVEAGVVPPGWGARTAAPEPTGSNARLESCLEGARGGAATKDAVRHAHARVDGSDTEAP